MRHEDSRASSESAQGKRRCPCPGRLQRWWLCSGLDWPPYHCLQKGQCPGDPTRMTAATSFMLLQILLAGRFHVDPSAPRAQAASQHKLATPVCFSPLPFNSVRLHTLAFWGSLSVPSRSYSRAKTTSFPGHLWHRILPPQAGGGDTGLIYVLL